ncbi:hypothetical protein [Streptomyces sp. NPDC010273]|uniref:hypothetical protein n=1 Tax=Streptomyces sp. NPDC010273 TaxID=3364829 RepID=UPI0036E13CFA
MTRLWTCGFELQSPNAEFGVNSGTVNGGDVTPGISTTVHRQGTASARFNLTAQTSYIEHQITTGVVGRTFHRLYVRVDTLPSTETNIYAVGMASYFPGSLRLLPTGQFVLRDSIVGTTLTGTSPAVTLGRWHRLEIDFTDAASGQTAFRGYMDGTLFSDGLCTAIGGFSRLRIGPQVAATVDLYIDDIAVNDTTGSVQTGLPGPGSVVHLRPNAAGDANTWASAVGGTAGTGNNYTRVSERPPDDATSYNQTTATGTTNVDDFNVENTADVGIGSDDSITLVQIGGRVASDATTAASIVYRIKGQAGGTVQESASVTVANTSWSVNSGQSPRPYMLTAYTNPQTSTAWTAATLDTAQIGYRGDVSQSTVRRVSTLWALVEFLPATAALPRAAETSTALTLTVRKRLTLPPAIESTAAQALARTKRTSLPAASETATAQMLRPGKAAPLGTAQETSAAQALTGVHRLALPTAQEAVTARPFTTTKATALPAAGETTAVQALIPAKAAQLPTATETTAVGVFGRLKATLLGIAAETSTARALALAKHVLLAPAAEATAAGALTPAKAALLPTAAETSQALPLTPGTPATGEVDYEVGQPTTAWSASPPHTTWEAGQPW